MPFNCKNPHGNCPGKISLKDSRTVYDIAKRCTVCDMYVEQYNKRCPCCSSPLRSKSKRAGKYRGVF